MFQEAYHATSKSLQREDLTGTIVVVAEEVKSETTLSEEVKVPVQCTTPNPQVEKLQQTTS